MRVRLRFSEVGKIRFTSHRDVARMWERAVRRVGLPIAYSEGFSPRPKVHFGLALSTGHESLGEYLDIDLAPADGVEIDIPGLPALLTPALPEGIDVQAAALTDRTEDSLQAAVTSCSWRLDLDGGTPEELTAAVEGLLAAPELIRTRQRKGVDVVDDHRPYIRDLSVVGPTPEGAVLSAHLGTQPRGLRPAELIALLGDGWSERRVCRTHQWMQLDGATREPLPLDATSAPHATKRAS